MMLGARQTKPKRAPKAQHSCALGCAPDDSGWSILWFLRESDVLVAGNGFTDTIDVPLDELQHGIGGCGVVHASSPSRRVGRSYGQASAKATTWPPQNASGCPIQGV